MLFDLRPEAPADQSWSQAGCKNRKVLAVATLDSVYFYDTQQHAPIGFVQHAHYAPLTDLAWSPNGESLWMTSQDGYCSVISFDSGELGALFVTGERVYVG